MCHNRCDDSIVFPIQVATGDEQPNLYRDILVGLTERVGYLVDLDASGVQAHKVEHGIGQCHRFAARCSASRARPCSVMTSRTL